MKAILARERTSIPGYWKYYIRFKDAKTSLERKIIKALSHPANVYIGGAEPKYTLYLGKKPIIVSEIVAEGPRTAEYYKKTVEAYTELCRCGMTFKNAKMLSRHQKKCQVLQDLAPFLERVARTLGVSSDSGRKGKKKKKKHHTADQLEKARRKRLIKKVEKKMARRKISAR